MSRTTKIAGRDVPIELGEVITINVTGGPNPGDAGLKDFWVVFNENKGRIGRWHRGEDPGERFRMMEGAKGYESDWEVARTAIGIRPATQEAPARRRLNFRELARPEAGGPPSLTELPLDAGTPRAAGCRPTRCSFPGARVYRNRHLCDASPQDYRPG